MFVCRNLFYVNVCVFMHHAEILCCLNVFGTLMTKKNQD